MKSILIPTDFSECANNAANYAMKLAEKLDYSVSILNAFHVPSAGATKVLGDLNRALEEERDLHLKALKVRLNEEYREIEINLISSFGTPVTEILDELNKKNYELIVMGTKGASGLKEVFIGSITANLIGRTEVPILAIPEGTQFVVPKTFTLLSDLEKLNDYKSHEFMALLARKFNANIEVIKVKEEGPNNEETIESVHENYKLRQLMKGLSYHLHLIKTNDVEKIVLKTTGSPSNILTLIHRKRSFFERFFHSRFSKKMAMHAKTPMLILEDK